jgi:alpha-glucosidase
MSDLDWWRGAVIYQIYPRSFLDTNGNGVGDLPGITQQLDYVSDLGVDGIWISPFFTSPMKDFGYDVSNYRDVDPLFGTLSDFDALLEKAHVLNLKIIIDLVLSHTSDQHPWFKQSCESRENKKSNWYVWADAKKDVQGKRIPPNNWVSVFGGPAWSYSEAREQYYLHNFLKEQPDLNFHNKDVQAEMLDIARFWLERNVDGFRLDTVNFYFHDPLLRDNPPRETGTEYATQFESDVPYSQQQHIHDKSQQENFDFLKKLRALMDQYPGTVTIGEIGDDDPYKLAQEYTRGQELLHTTYNPHMMSGTQKTLTEALIRKPIETFYTQPDTPEYDVGWPSWAFSNHDVVRAASRWLSPFAHDPALSKMLIVLLGCLPGTGFLYQGEELGLPEADIPFEDIQDPWAKETWPAWQGRDGCRTPMPWRDEKYCGFSAHTPWLPIPKGHAPLSVQNQNSNPESVLVFTRTFLKWRKKRQEIVKGGYKFYDTSNEYILHLSRYNNKNKTGCIFNLSQKLLTYNGREIPPYGFLIDGFTVK